MVTSGDAYEDDHRAAGGAAAPGKAEAARSGHSFKHLLTEALRDRLGRSGEVVAGEEEWRSVFGAAKASQVKTVDDAVERDLERVDPETWR
jgi:hypothetical protein